MKTFKYILLGMILSSLIFSSFSFNPLNKPGRQEQGVVFRETYTQEEVISQLDKEDAFFTWVHMENTDPGSSRIGTCSLSDLNRLFEHVQSEAFRGQVQKDLVLSVGAEAKNQMVSLYAIREPGKDDSFPLQQDIEEISVSQDGPENTYSLLISFSRSGAEKWADMTRLNKGRDIAIMYKGQVLSAPRVMEEIKGGKCSISGNYTESDINELKEFLEN